MGYRVIIISFFLGWNVAGLLAADFDVRFLRGLTDRNLFESVEIFCNNEFQKPKMTATEKNILAAELVRARTRQMLLAEPKRRNDIQKKIAELAGQFVETPEESNDPEFLLSKITLEFQLAIAAYSLGDWQRLEAELEPDNIKDEKAKQVRTTLLDALERFKRGIEQLDSLRQKTGLNTDPFERRCLALRRTIQFQAGLAQKSFALSFPPNDDRVFGLNRTVEMLTEIAALPIDDPIVIQCRIESATAYRLLGNLEKSKECLTALQIAQQKVPRAPELQFQAETELIRYILATGNLNEAVKRIETERSDSSVYPDYDLAKLEVLLALSRQTKGHREGHSEGHSEGQGDKQEELNQAVLDLVRKIDQQSGAYWGRRAGMVLGASYFAADSAEDNTTTDAPLLEMLAKDRFQRGQFTESVRFFELASRRAEAAGDQDGAFKNAVSAVAVLGNILERLESATEESAVSAAEIESVCRQTVNSLQKVAKRFAKHPEAAELHLKAVDLAAQSVLLGQANQEPANREAGRYELSEYLALLKEHAELWADSQKVPPLLLRAAALLESQGQSVDALAMLEKIPNRSAAGLEAVHAAQRCFGTEIDDLEIADWFERRLPGDAKTAWNEADVVSAIHAAEHRIHAFSAALNTPNAEIPKRAEQLLRGALERFPELKPSTKVQIQAMLVTVLNDQGRKEEGAAILKTLDDDHIGSLSAAEKLVFRRVQVKLLADTGKTQDAVDQLKIFLKQYPNDIPLLEILAEILSQQTDSATLEKAVERWAFIANQSPKHSETWWTARERIIEIHLKLNKTAEAKKEFETLRLLYPDLGGEARKIRLERRFH